MSVLIEGFSLKGNQSPKNITKQNDLFTNLALHSHRPVMKCKLKCKGHMYKKFIKLYSK